MVLKANLTVVNEENIEETSEAAGRHVGWAFWASHCLPLDFLQLVLLLTHTFTNIPPINPTPKQLLASLVTVLAKPLLVASSTNLITVYEFWKCGEGNFYESE